MFDDFINAYKATFFKDFADDFLGRFKRFQSEILDPKFHPSSELKDELRKLEKFICEPLNIAIVGQFSSGKSTFLNAILGAEILPTGLTPVTAKPTQIKYAKNYSLRVDYESGRELYLGVEEIAKFVDQRMFSEDVKSLCIYAPCEILKYVSFVDTPGLNSLSNADTAVTKRVLSDVAAVIWLSMAENAGRASELKDVKEFLLNNDKIGLCVINQKDKLSQKELEDLLAHCENTFENLFTNIIAISSKQALQAIKNGDKELMKTSNFDEILTLISGLDFDAIKQNFVHKKTQNILNEIILSHIYFNQIYNKADEIIQNFHSNLPAKIHDAKEKFLPKLQLCFNEIKGIAKLISDEILGSLKTKKMYKFLPKNGVFDKGSFKRLEYEMVALDSDEVFSKLIYNDIKFDKIFKTYKRNLKQLENELVEAIDAIYESLKYEFLIYRSEFANVMKEQVWQSDRNFAAIRTYAGQIYALFLRDFESVKFEQTQKIALFFERLNLKAASNYENAVKIAVFSVQEKIEFARAAHEKDPLKFSLFIPTSDDIFNKVLLSLSLHEFESEMLSNVSFLNKILAQLSSEFGKLKVEKCTKISEFIAKNDEILNSLRQSRV